MKPIIPILYLMLKYYNRIHKKLPLNNKPGLEFKSIRTWFLYFR